MTKSAPKLIDTQDELRANTLTFATGAPALAAKASSASQAIANGCSHAVEWVAFPDEIGEWKVAFSKYAGYSGLTFDRYAALYRTHLTGTDTKRRVEKLGGTYFGVGADANVPSNHPAVDAVKAMCSLFGKTPKRTAKVRVFPAAVRPAAMDILVAAIRAANLSAEEVKRLFVEVQGAA